MISSAVTGSPAAASMDKTTSSYGSAGSVDSMFLQLLITQLKNQDPLSPADPSAFVQQLAQVSSLDQLTQINQLLQNALAGYSTTATHPSSGGQ